MKLAVDVYYSQDKAFAAAITFSSWKDESHERIYTINTAPVHDYEPGAFYKRELPCILELLQRYALEPETIVIDGYVFLDGKSRAGLGKHLYDALNCSVKVIGVAKRPFYEIGREYEIFRGSSRRPLYVTSAGISLEEAKRGIETMAGRYRIPRLLKKVDQVSRGLAM